MNNEPKTIAIKGAFGCGNFGDDALMLAAYEITRKAFDTESIILLCDDSNYIKKMIPSAKVVSGNNIVITDFLIYGGGTQFYSFPLTSVSDVLFFFRRVIDNLSEPVKLWRKIFHKIISTFAQTTTQRVAALGIGLGPFIHNNFLATVKERFRSMDYIAVRDIKSYDICNEWKCTNLTLGSDLCYLPGLWRDSPTNLQIDHVDFQIGRIGIIPRDWPHTYEGNSYADSLFKVVDELRLAGKIVEFISFSEEGDCLWAKHLEARHERFIAWKPQDISIPVFLEMLSGYDAFISARYHGAIFASILGKPVVCIEIEPKLRLVADLFGDGARLWTYPFNPLDCLDYIYNLQANYLKSVDYLARVVTVQGQLAEQIIEDLKTFLSSGEASVYEERSGYAIRASVE